MAVASGPASAACDSRSPEGGTVDGPETSEIAHPRARDRVDRSVIHHRRRGDPTAPPAEILDQSRSRLPDHPRRVDARRQRPTEPGDVRQHLDGAAGRRADGRVLRQEHDRQGRVPADRRDGDALRQHPGRPVECPGRRARDRLLDHRLQRGGDARRPGAQVALAASGAAARASRPTSPTWSWASTSRCAGRSSPATGTSRCAWSRWRATASTWTPRRPSSACDENTIGVVAILGSTFDGAYEPVADICRSSRRVSERHRPGHSGPRRRRVRRLHRAVPRPRSGVGLPAAAGRVDQHLGPQVRARLSRRRLGRSGATPKRCPRT